MSLEIFENQYKSFAFGRGFEGDLPFINPKCLANTVENSTDYSNMLRIFHVVSYYTNKIA
jgi:hypothetical protein